MRGSEKGKMRSVCRPEVRSGTQGSQGTDGSFPGQKEEDQMFGNEMFSLPYR